MALNINFGEITKQLSDGIPVPGEVFAQRRQERDASAASQASTAATQQGTALQAIEARQKENDLAQAEQLQGQVQQARATAAIWDKHMPFLDGSVLVDKDNDGKVDDSPRLKKMIESAQRDLQIPGISETQVKMTQKFLDMAQRGQVEEFVKAKGDVQKVFDFLADENGGNDASFHSLSSAGKAELAAAGLDARKVKVQEGGLGVQQTNAATAQQAETRLQGAQDNPAFSSNNIFAVIDPNTGQQTGQIDMSKDEVPEGMILRKMATQKQPDAAIGGVAGEGAGGVGGVPTNTQFEQDFPELAGENIIALSTGVESSVAGALERNTLTEGSIQGASKNVQARQFMEALGVDLQTVFVNNPRMPVALVNQAKEAGLTDVGGSMFSSESGIRNVLTTTRPLAIQQLQRDLEDSKNPGLTTAVQTEAQKSARQLIDVLRKIDTVLDSSKATNIGIPPDIQAIINRNRPQ